MSAPVRTAAEMDRIREAEARIQEKLRREFKPEPNTTKSVGYIQVEKYVTGPLRGMFKLTELVTEENGKPLKKPLAKVISDGHFKAPTCDAMATWMDKVTLR